MIQILQIETNTIVVHVRFAINVVLASCLFVLNLIKHKIVMCCSCGCRSFTKLVIQKKLRKVGSKVYGKLSQLFFHELIKVFYLDSERFRFIHRDTYLCLCTPLNICVDNCQFEAFGFCHHYKNLI